MAITLWNKGTTATDLVEDYTVGSDRELDLRLAKYDVQGSLAHIKMLLSINLLTADEERQLEEGLKQIAKEIEKGEFALEPNVEDIHSQVEILLTQRLGSIGKKIHSGRSRNDQVLVDLKLFLKEECEKVRDEVVALFDTLLSLSEKYKKILLPGYTHFQIAMPSSFGLWLGAYAESLADDMLMLKAAHSIADMNPLGSAAGYGSSFPLNREMTAELLNFKTLSYNSIAAQMGRGKTEKAVAAALSQIAGTLNKLAEDCCIYMCPNFGFIKFPDELTTGSSIMPHKKNPDVWEIIRGNCNIIQSKHTEITMMTTNLPHGYHRDYQLLKETLFPALEKMHKALYMTKYMLERMQVNKSILDNPLYDNMFTVEKVNRLVLEGVPFRDAYKTVGKEVNAGKFKYDHNELKHTHLGSIGNLATKEIRKKMAKAKFMIIAIAMLLLSLAGGFNANAQNKQKSYGQLWKQVEQAKRKALPKTSIELCDKIIEKAAAEKNTGQYLKGYFERNSYKYQTEPDKIYTILADTEEMAKGEADSVGKMILHNCLAQMYEALYMGKAYRLSQKTPIQGNAPDVKDMDEWDSKRWQGAIILHVRAALENMQKLHKASMTHYKPFAELNWSSEYYKHDVLHVVAKNSLRTLYAIRPYTQNDKSANKAVTELIEHIYSSLSDIYKTDNCKEAEILIALEKITEDPRQHDYDYTVKAIDSLKRVCDSTNVMYAELLCAQAERFIGRGEKGKGMALLDKIIKNYPKFPRIENVKYQKAEVERDFFSFDIPEFAYTGDSLVVRVSYCNTRSLNIKLYKLPEDAGYYRLENSRKFDISKLKLAQSSHHELQGPKNEEDRYKEISAFIKIKVPEYGCYVVTADNNDNYAILRSTKLIGAVLQKEDLQSELIIADRKTGKPIEGAEYTVRNYRLNSETTSTVRGKTDKDGRASIKIEPNSNTVINCALGKDTNSYTRPYVYNFGKRSAQKREAVQLLTDRAIYRPGQTVNVYGLAYSQLDDSVNVVKERDIALVMNDANNKTVGKKSLRTNGFGSVSASFTLPQKTLNGVYRLYAEGLSSNYCSFSVEEYKRPTFEIKIDKINEGFKTGDSVTIRGSVQNYSGVATDVAKASFKTTRRAFFWGRSPLTTVVEEKPFNVTQDGAFSFKTNLKEGDGRFYLYDVEVTVTNASGETQIENTTVSAGKDEVYFNVEGLKDNVYLCKDDGVKASISARNFVGNKIDTTIRYELYTSKYGNAAELKASGEVKANTTVHFEKWDNLPSGSYILKYASESKPIVLFSTLDEKPAAMSELWVYKKGDKIYYGTSYKDATIFIDIFADGKRISHRNAPLSNKIEAMEIPYNEAFGKGASVNFMIIREGRTISKNVTVPKPQPKTKLNFRWQTFRDRLSTGGREEWSLYIEDTDGKPAKAELVAFMYDAALEAYRKYSLNNFIYFDRSIPTSSWQSRTMSDRISYYGPLGKYKGVHYSYDAFANSGISYPVTMKAFAYIGHAGTRALAMNSKKAYDSAPIMEDVAVKEDAAVQREGEKAENILRQNFAETAFFYPHLKTDSDGRVAISFTLPQSLTRWNFRGMAHTENMHIGFLDTTAVAQKEFMLQPNLPRFLRTGDEAKITATLTNLTDAKQTTDVYFEISDYATEKVLEKQKTRVKVAAKGSVAVPAFKYAVPDGYGVLCVKMYAQSGKFGDGEQHLLAILPDRERVIESIPIPVRGSETKEVSLEGLFNNHSSGATQKALTVEFAGNPAWFAVQSLAPMSTPKTESAVEWCNSLYANALAQYIVKTNPKIASAVKAWQLQDDAPASNLERNQELKTILLEETPWVTEANTESEQKRALVTLFDMNNLNERYSLALKKLMELQREDGGWAWYKGMCSYAYITEYVMTQLARLQELTHATYTPEILQMTAKGLAFMQKKTNEEYDRILKSKSSQKGISNFALNYLYIIALQPKGYIVPKEFKEAYDYFMKHLNDEPRSQSLKERALAAIILNRAGKETEAGEYMQSLWEHLFESDEMGRFLNGADISTQVAAIEAFDEVSHDSLTVNEMKIWLLKQKQILVWPSGPQTSEAVYALLKRGDDLLASDNRVEVELGSETLTGGADYNYIKREFTTPEMVDSKSITIRKSGSGIAWGGVYALFYDKIGSLGLRGSKALSVKKELYIKRGEELIKMDKDHPAKIGETVVARVTLKSDRDLDFVQFKEEHAACLEPVKRTTGYSFDGGTSYYTELKDASTNIFFDNMRGGSYVIEIAYVANNAGVYESGVATLQCAYAPEFTAHSKSEKLYVVF